MTNGRILIIGAGAIGVTTALYVQRMGFSVTIVDSAGEAGAGCSHANAGLLAPSHAFPLTGMSSVITGLKNITNSTGPFRLSPRKENVSWIPRFVRASVPRRVHSTTKVLRRLCAEGSLGHASLKAEGLPTSWVNQGMLDVFSRERDVLAAQRSLSEHPVRPRYQILDNAQLAARVPGLTNFSAGIYTPDDSHCDGRTFVSAIAAQAAKEGVQFLFNTRTTALATQSKRVQGVETQSGTLHADHVVVAAGTGSKHLLKSVGLHLPLASGKGYVVDIATGEDDPPMPIGLKAKMMVVTPYPDKIRLAGVLELVGEDRTIDEKRTRAMVDHATEALPQLAGREILQVWSGMRPCTADGLPIVGRTTTPGLSVATGHGQQGLILAPITAEIVAAQLSGRPGTPPGVDPWRISPARFIQGCW